MVPPPVEQDKDRFLRLSEDLEGEILQPVWFRSVAEIEALYGPGSYPTYTRGRFRYHWFLAFNGERPKHRLAVFLFYLRTGLRLCREHGITCIVVYSHMTTAVCGLILKLLTGAKLIPEVMIAPERAYLTDRAKPGAADRIMHFYSDMCLYLSVGLCDRVHLLYPTQLDAYSLLSKKKRSVFHDYTPVTAIQPSSGLNDDRPLVVMAGYPWYRKGIDLAITAFGRLASDFPNARLKILGHYPDGKPQAQAKSCESIEILPPAPHDQLMKLLSHAAILILPSRNEGLPRILIEGMMAGLPLIGSDVAGIPFLIEEGRSGFVVPDGDAEALEKRLRELLANGAARSRMGARSREMALETLTEEAYARNFVEMVRTTVA